MKLFSCEDGFNVSIEPEILLIHEFNALYIDRKGNENLVLKELAYIYFMYEPSSDFQQQRSESTRSEEVIKHINLPSGWSPDSHLKICIDIFKERSYSMAAMLLQDAYDMVDKIRAEMKAIDLGEKDKSGKPIYNLKQIMETSKLVPSVLELLIKAEKEYIKGQAEVNLNKGSKTKSAYEDM